MRRIESTFSKLDKILTLEQRKGFQDQAVIGGLEPFLARWIQEAKEEAGPDNYQRIDDLIALFRGYALADSTVRQEVVAEAKARLAQWKAEGLWKGRVLPRPTPPATMPAKISIAQDQPETISAEAMAPTMPAHVRPGFIPAPVPAPRPRLTTIGLDSPISALQGVGSNYGSCLARLGVRTIRDLLYLFPRRYNDYTTMRKIAELRVGEIETIAGTIWEIQNSTTSTGKTITTAIISDETGKVRAVWFNQPFLAQTLSKGKQVVLSGRVGRYLGYPNLESPEYELLESEDLIHTGRLVPVYPLTEGLSARWLRRLQKRVVDRWAPQVVDHLPPAVRQRAGLLDLPIALAQIHFPDNHQTLEQARRRLAFDEFFLIQLGLLQRRRDWREAQAGPAMQVQEDLINAFLESLPFTLTTSQHRVLREILADMSKPVPMARLLQGEVGSGKTVVAAAAMFVAWANGFQAAMMVPTEILAEQHYRTISQILTNNGAALCPSPAQNYGTPVVRLLTGSLKESEKARIRAEVAAGEAHIVIGTHAIIQEGVEFANLGLVIIDEQHRFGVMQRAALRLKGNNPHVLVMTATPIPRTLALTIYGDLDISVIDQLPPGRQEIKTRWLEPRERERAYSFIRRQVEQGRQAFIICPLVEESEALEVKAATEEYERLRTEVFPDLRLGLLHGRMKPQEKDAVMRAFREHQLDILVSTPVVEVGIDVPNATVMLIEGADRFGLSQLHQFRGRVGRGEHPSWCLLLAEKPGDEARKRLGIIESTQDGFLLAEEDLKMRGPGEFFGVRQSGLPDLRVARLGDLSLLEQAREEARRLFEEDRYLQQPEHQLLRQMVARFWERQGDVS